MRGRSVLLSSTVAKICLGSRLFKRREKTSGVKCGGVGGGVLVLSARGLRLKGTGIGLEFRRKLVSPTCGICRVIGVSPLFLRR